MRDWIADLPAGPDALCRIVQGLLLHDHYGDLEDSDFARRNDIDRKTFPLSDRLSSLRGADGRAPRLARTPAARSVGTCRDFAVMLCGFLRDRGVAARVRCGFARYLSTSGGPAWEDHWITEYLPRAEGEWHRADAQLTPTLSKHLDISFPIHDVPSGWFLTGAEAWRAVRRGDVSATDFGHGRESRGLPFAAVNLARDALALRGELISNWDGWRAAGVHASAVEGDQLVVFDALAEDPGNPIPRPFFL